MQSRLIGTLVLVLSLLATPAATASVAPDHRITAADDVAGPGSYLAIVDHGARGDHGIEPRRQRLALVAPDGTQRTVLERQGTGYRSVRLVDWSPDGSTALLLTGPEDRTRAITVDVATGDTTTTRVPSDAASVLLDPAGAGLLIAAFGDRTGQPLYRLAWDGTRTDLDVRVAGTLLVSPDGTSLLTNGQSWRAKVMRVLSATDGSVVRRIAVDGRCQPVRWWDDHRALLTCGRDLALLDPATRTMRRLTDQHALGIGDLGHLDARRVVSGLYVQVAGGCGDEFIGRRHHDGRVTAVRFPHAIGDVHLLGTAGDRLVVEHAQSCDGAAPRSVIARFAPTTGHERTLVRLPSSEAFGRILAFGERHPLGS